MHEIELEGTPSSAPASSLNISTAPTVSITPAAPAVSTSPTISTAPAVSTSPAISTAPVVSTSPVAPAISTAPASSDSSTSSNEQDASKILNAISALETAVRNKKGKKKRAVGRSGARSKKNKLGEHVHYTVMKLHCELGENAADGHGHVRAISQNDLPLTINLSRFIQATCITLLGYMDRIFFELVWSSATQVNVNVDNGSIEPINKRPYGQRIYPYMEFVESCRRVFADPIKWSNANGRQIAVLPYNYSSYVSYMLMQIDRMIQADFASFLLVFIRQSKSLLVNDDSTSQKLFSVLAFYFLPADSPFFRTIQVSSLPAVLSMSLFFSLVFPSSRLFLNFLKKK